MTITKTVNVTGVVLQQQYMPPQQTAPATQVYMVTCQTTDAQPQTFSIPLTAADLAALSVPAGNILVGTQITLSIALPMPSS